MIVVGGEALVDLVDEGGMLRPVPGGGPFNTAVALGRLGVPVGFLGALSTDAFGRRLGRTLETAGVDLGLVRLVDAPTPVAIVGTGADGEAEYAFHLAGTAYACLTPASLPSLPDACHTLHLGTLALAVDPPAGAYEALLDRVSERRLIVLDPNVRPAVFGDRETYRARFERLAGRSHIVKLSVADMAWLYPGATAEDIVDRLLALGVTLVAVTLGADGAMSATATERVTAAGVACDVVDTIGAGDSFGAALLAGLADQGVLDPKRLPAVDATGLRDATSFAVAAASITCSRRGADAPTRLEVDELVSSLTVL